MDTQKVVFLNKALNTRMAGLLYIPDNFNLSENYPAVVVTGPILKDERVLLDRNAHRGF